MGLPNRSVLLVDDSPQVLKRLKSLLSENNAGITLANATGFVEAVVLLEKKNFDIVLLDIHFPDGNGIDLLRRIKKEQPSVKVIMITNHSGPYYKEVCEQLGASHFIDKSVDFEQLPALIDGLG